MLKRILIPLLVALAVAGAAGAYLFTANRTYFETTQSVEVVEEGAVEYAVKFVDSEGNPVPGVVCNVCDEERCTMLTSGEDGCARFEGADYPWKLQVLTVPAGYALPDAAIELAPGETEVALENG